MRNNNNDGQRTVFGMLTARCVVTDRGIKMDRYTGIGIVPTEILKDDGYLGDYRNEVEGQTLVMHHEKRNAFMRAEPLGGRRFIPVFDKKQDGTDASPQVGDEIMILLQVNHPDYDPRDLQHRYWILSWASMESYLQATKECERQNAKIPELEGEIAAEERTLWRMQSEMLNLDLEWMTPAKIKDRLYGRNGNMVPPDAKWFQRDLEITKQLVGADAAKRLELIEQIRKGKESSARPAKLMMLRTGLFIRQETARPSRRPERMDAEQKEALQEHKSDGAPLSAPIPFPTPVASSSGEAQAKKVRKAKPSAKGSKPKTKTAAVAA